MTAGAAVMLFICLLVATLAIVQFGFRFVYGYRLGPKGLDFVLFGRLAVWRIPVEDIATILEMTWADALFCRIPGMLLAFRAGNRIWGPALLIRRRRGVVRLVAITPDDPGSFLREYRKLLPTPHA